MTVSQSSDKPAHRVLVLPGWQGSGPDHWQTLWQVHGDQRVEQDDWFWPRRGDWMAQLEHAVLADPRDVLFVAHSLGCHLVDAWAAHTALTSRVRGALLVAPPDLDRDDLVPQLAPWRRAVRRALPFASTLVYSDDDPHCVPACSLQMAEAWGSTAVAAGARGHLNAASGLGAWPEGRQWLQALVG